MSISLPDCRRIVDLLTVSDSALSDDLKCETLLELWKGTGARITERRSYEWKIAFGVWGALLVTLGEVITHSQSFRSGSIPHLGDDFQMGGIALTTIHAVYVLGFVWFRNKKDSRTAIHYENQILKTLTVPPVPPVTSKWRMTRWLLNQSWSSSIPAMAVPLFQVGITGFLAVIIGPAAIHAVG